MLFPRKICAVGLAVFVVAVTGTVVTVRAQQIPQIGSSVANAIAPLQNTSGEENLNKRLKEVQRDRYQTLHKEMELVFSRSNMGRDFPFQTKLQTCKNYCLAGLDLDQGNASLEAEHLKKWVEKTTEIERETKAMFDGGLRLEQELMQVRAARQEAEIALLKFQIKNAGK
ncbi:hypothetical protein KIH39_20700 [Telmatocola sphagniphila]|uniref:Uncharacterized protein n=1 Tax=Telmatocola sphagniphila TaxID=1123043 RepID=A0A8E6B3L4_9BACT|nr:hypothetical protein [Telmatocola sphagniphila]QVL31242.1 hypothetical protein KIH39_20700 [Telmatocola sphagniphila]